MFYGKGRQITETLTARLHDKLERMSRIMGRLKAEPTSTLLLSLSCT